MEENKSQLPKTSSKILRFIDFCANLVTNEAKKTKKEGQLGKRNQPYSTCSKNLKNFESSKSTRTKQGSQITEKVIKDASSCPKRADFFGDVDIEKLKEFINDSLPECIDRILEQIEVEKKVRKKDVLKKLAFLESEINRFLKFSKNAEYCCYIE